MLQFSIQANNMNAHQLMNKWYGIKVIKTVPILRIPAYSDPVT